MEISRLRALRGPNLWSRHTSIEALVHCEEPERRLEADFEARLRARFPDIGPLRPVGHRDRISLARALEAAALALQAHAGCPVSFSRCSPTVETGVYQVVVEYSEEPVGRLAFQFAIEL
ncbi:MAG: cyanophycin synthetase, partial [Burkholderiales bacterium]|nr:cyanophycin synthetase [Burkholderiales bacterium]